MYKEASKLQLRITTPKGELSVEQLWSLSLGELDTLAISLQEEAEKSKTKSFLEKRTTVDKLAKLQFDIVLDILQTKVAENDAARTEVERKEHNQKILNLIAEKKDQDLKGKSIEELQGMLQ